MYLLFTLNLSASKPGYTSLSLFLGPFAPFQTLLVLIEAFSKYLEVKRDSIKRSLPCYGTNFCPSKCIPSGNILLICRGLTHQTSTPLCP